MCVGSVPRALVRLTSGYGRRMGRPRRLEVEDGIFHITTNANFRRVAFGDTRDRRLFLSILDAACELYRWECHAWCLMTTHYHLLVRTRGRTLADGMQLLNGSYARKFNKRRGIGSHVFGARYYSGLVGSEPHFVATLRYIALNPVAAGICRRPDEWPWSSYAVWARSGTRPALLAEPLLDELRGPLALTWLRSIIEPYAALAAVAGAYGSTVGDRRAPSRP
jgi:putative transposase